MRFQPNLPQSQWWASLVFLVWCEVPMAPCLIRIDENSERGMASLPGSSACTPCQPSLSEGTPSSRSRRLRISALLHFRRKSPVCLPSTVYKAGSTTVCRLREFIPSDIVLVDCCSPARRGVRRALPAYRYGFGDARRGTSLSNAIVSAAHGLRRRSRRILVPPPTELRIWKQLARREQALMPAIYCVQPVAPGRTALLAPVVAWELVRTRAPPRKGFSGGVLSASAGE
jgi:hypothetical protein